MSTPAEEVFKLVGGMSTAAIITTAAKLRLADAVGEEPADARDLAETLGLDADVLTRLLRALVAFGVFRQVRPGVYEHTERSRAMRSDAKERLLDRLLTGTDFSWRSWGMLPDAVRTGRCPFPDGFGTDFFAYLDRHPDAQSRMFRGITASFDPLLPLIADALDIAGARSLADVGGGKGTLLRLLLEREPHLRGVLFESESTLRLADEQLRSGPLASRCDLVAGDFFQQITCDVDVYLFKLTLHMYDDEDCERILRNCAAAAQPGARIVIADPLLTDPPRSPFAPTMDLHMLLLMGGRERTAEGYQALVARSGLRMKAVTPLPRSTSLELAIVEAVV
ncbi:methyltransferase [Amycolatopsis rubida]|uniref:methyltransferase n=1 Tax=Amycolatopsis rubida TaxID=112413 RepID=UPI00142F2907|nr:methyltransferase [Amycolatopsis rubida]